MKKRATYDDLWEKRFDPENKKLGPLPNEVKDLLEPQLKKKSIQPDAFLQNIEKIFEKFIWKKGFKKFQETTSLKELLKDLGDNIEFEEKVFSITDKDIEKFIIFLKTSVLFPKEAAQQIILTLQKIQNHRKNDLPQVEKLKKSAKVVSLGLNIRRSKWVTDMMCSLAKEIDPFFEDCGNQFDLEPLLRTDTSKVISSLINWYFNFPEKFSDEQVRSRITSRFEKEKSSSNKKHS